MRASKEGTAASRSGKFKSEQEWGRQCFEDLDQRRLWEASNAHMVYGLFPQGRIKPRRNRNMAEE
jgi:hypothetical protein